MRRAVSMLVCSLIALASSVALLAAQEGISDQQREKWAKGVVAYGAGRVEQGERGSDESRENAVNIATIAEGARNPDADLADPEDADFPNLLLDAAKTGARILGTLDAQRQDGTLATPQESGLDYVTAKGDARFRDEAAAQGLGFEDNIDLDNGMQAMLMRHPGTGRAVIVMRGTEVTAATLTETARDIAADLQGVAKNQHAIGKAQYEAAKDRLYDWVDGDVGNIEVIGHSLGGALGQRLMLDRARDINQATFFNTPALEKAAIQRLADNPGLVRDLMVAGNQRKVRIYNSEGDKVSAGGNGGFILGDVIMSSGKSIAESPHMASPFAPDVQRKVRGYYSYNNMRGDLAEAADFLGDIMGLANGHLGDRTDMAEVMAQIASRETEERRANPDTQTHVGLDAFTLMRAPLADILSRVSVAESSGEPMAPEAFLPVDVDVAGQDDAVAGQTAPLQTGVGAAKPAMEPGLEQEQDGIYGSFSGTLTSLDQFSRISGGRITLHISGTRVTGTATGRNVAKSETPMSDAFRLSITGTYNPKTGQIDAAASGAVGEYGRVTISIDGQGGPEGFRGRFYGLVTGSWRASP